MLWAGLWKKQKTLDLLTKLLQNLQFLPRRLLNFMWMTMISTGIKLILMESHQLTFLKMHNPTHL